MFAGDMSPLEVMLAKMRGDQSITHAQFEAALAAAPYVHPKLAATMQANVEATRAGATQMQVARALAGLDEEDLGRAGVPTPEDRIAVGGGHELGELGSLARIR